MNTFRPGPPSGAQWEITSSPWQATIVEVGGGIRTLSRDGVDILDPYPVDAMCDGAHGTPLVPWPNRMADGHYVFDGVEQQVPITEPARHNAIHGFLRWDSWTLVEHGADEVRVAARIHPRTGYPFDLRVEVAYRLEAAGLMVTTTATNVGVTDLPFASGQHPYLSAGGGTLDECELTFPATTRLVNDDRGIPVGAEPAAATPFDFTARRGIGDLAMDEAFTDLVRSDDGLAWTGLHRPDGVEVRLWQDQTYRYLEIFTGDTLAPDRRRRGLGVEPMTAAPNAFVSGAGLRRIRPGDSFASQWGLTAR